MAARMQPGERRFGEIHRHAAPRAARFATAARPGFGQFAFDECALHPLILLLFPLAISRFM
jgi:hypothetical protein